MIMTEREKTREDRKLKILTEFSGKETLYTNTVAKKIGVVWIVADGLLQELVEDGLLSGDKLKGYTFRKLSLGRKIKRLFHV